MAVVKGYEKQSSIISFRENYCFRTKRFSLIFYNLQLHRIQTCSFRAIETSNIPFFVLFYENIKRNMKYTLVCSRTCKYVC